MATAFASTTALSGGVSASNYLFHGTNNPQVEQQVNGLFGQFKAVASGLGEGIQKTTESATTAIAILYLINRAAASAPGLAQSYTMQVAKAKGSIFGAKLFNFALSKIDPEVRDVIDSMFGGVKAQMCQALELLNDEYSPDVDPTVDEVKAHIAELHGIRGMGMTYMSKKQAQIRAERMEQARKDQLFRDDEKNRKDEAARQAGFTDHEAFVAAETARVERERMATVSAAIAERGSPATIGSLQEGRFYLFLNGELKLVEASDTSAIMRCAASIL